MAARPPSHGSAFILILLVALPTAAAAILIVYLALSLLIHH